ncbi:MAG: hypothetical protein ACC613_10805 [Synergistales bacterium]
MDISAERDTTSGFPLQEHTLALRLNLDVQERVEAEILFRNPEHIMANCMALASDGVTLWIRTSKGDEPFESVRPWTLRLKDLIGGFVFSSPSAEALDPLETHFKSEWLRSFRREWAIRKAFWTSKPQDFAMECEKAKEKLSGIILN